MQKYAFHYLSKKIDRKYNAQQNKLNYLEKCLEKIWAQIHANVKQMFDKCLTNFWSHKYEKCLNQMFDKCLKTHLLTSFVKYLTIVLTSNTWLIYMLAFPKMCRIFAKYLLNVWQIFAKDLSQNVTNIYQSFHNNIFG